MVRWRYVSLLSFLRSIQDFDTRTFLSVAARQPSTSLLARAALIVSATADGWLYALLVPVLILARPESAREVLQLALTAFVFERCCYFVLKNTFRRNRPQQALAGFMAAIKPSDRFSLPSGHTSAAFLFVTLLCVFVSPLLSPLFLWAGAVGASRVILGVHFPSDIVMGAALGTSVGLSVV